MEPRRDDGDDDAIGVTAAKSVMVGPQWSPVVTTGTTLPAVTTVSTVTNAAMEPRRDDGDDSAGVVAAVAEEPAAMEPRRDDGDDLTEPHALHSRHVAPQWSPVVTTGTTWTGALYVNRASYCRNGAPS